MSLVTEDVIYSFIAAVQMVGRRCIFRPWVAEKQYTDMFSVANFIW